MRIFAISDLHLSFSSDKPMDVFGTAWENHTQRLADNWQTTVGEQDLVLMPGDISWAMQLRNAAEDLDFLGKLNGKKLIIRGNHDYWWNSLTQVRAFLPSSVFALQNDAFETQRYSIGGTRLWSLEDAKTESGRHIYNREIERLKLSLGRMESCKEKIVMTHYPPFDEARQQTAATDILEENTVRTVVYGHLHGKAHCGAFNGEKNGIRYQLVSADYLRFCPIQIGEE